MMFQYGDIILVHGDNLVSEAIQHLTQCFFSHAALCTEPGKIAEMTRFGFKYRDNHYLSGSRPYVVLRHQWLFQQNPRKFYFLKKIKNTIEKFRKNPPKYDYFEILMQALKLILSREEHLTKNGERYVSIGLLMAVSERLICSALVDTVYELAGIDLFPNRVSKHTTPADIASLATAGNQVLLEVYRSPGVKREAEIK